MAKASTFKKKRLRRPFKKKTALSRWCRRPCSRLNLVHPIWLLLLFLYLVREDPLLAIPNNLRTAHDPDELVHVIHDRHEILHFRKTYQVLHVGIDPHRLIGASQRNVLQDYLVCRLEGRLPVRILHEPEQITFRTRADVLPIFRKYWYRSVPMIFHPF